jgi:hypothetical protein
MMVADIGRASTSEAPALSEPERIEKGVERERGIPAC